MLGILSKVSIFWQN